MIRRQRVALGSISGSSRLRNAAITPPSAMNGSRTISQPSRHRANKLPNITSGKTTAGFSGYINASLGETVK